jgi:hypothetical protein
MWRREGGREREREGRREEKVREMNKLKRERETARYK